MGARAIQLRGQGYRVLPGIPRNPSVRWRFESPPLTCRSPLEWLLLFIMMITVNLTLTTSNTIDFQELLVH